MKNNPTLVIAAGLLISSLPVTVTLAVLALAPPKEKISVLREYALAYEGSADKEKYLAKIYQDVKDVNEQELPPDLMSFVVRVKVSQFCK